MSRFAGLGLFLAFVGLTLLSVFVEEPWIRTPASVLALAAMIAACVAMPEARAAAADRIPGTRWLGRTVMALRWRSWRCAGDRSGSPSPAASPCSCWRRWSRTPSSRAAGSTIAFVRVSAIFTLVLLFFGILAATIVRLVGRAHA